ncbi:hypothetical protein ACH42_08750 [Endozoicomonas sp. (ex Bugula neritina AB1)]|nr:hypothetical protein ACH42_08750 [Endozoicomonas sp. (ex Bugula neritina AB1)]
MPNIHCNKLAWKVSFCCPLFLVVRSNQLAMGSGIHRQELLPGDPNQLSISSILGGLSGIITPTKIPCCADSFLPPSMIHHSPYGGQFHIALSMELHVEGVYSHTLIYPISLETIDPQAHSFFVRSLEIDEHNRLIDQENAPAVTLNLSFSSSQRVSMLTSLRDQSGNPLRSVLPMPSSSTSEPMTILSPLPGEFQIAFNPENPHAFHPPGSNLQTGDSSYSFGSSSGPNNPFLTIHWSPLMNQNGHIDQMMSIALFYREGSLTRSGVSLEPETGTETAEDSTATLYEDMTDSTPPQMMTQDSGSLSEEAATSKPSIVGVTPALPTVEQSETESPTHSDNTLQEEIRSPRHTGVDSIKPPLASSFTADRPDRDGYTYATAVARSVNASPSSQRSTRQRDNLRTTPRKPFKARDKQTQTHTPTPTPTPTPTRVSPLAASEKDAADTRKLDQSQDPHASNNNPPQSPKLKSKPAAKRHKKRFSYEKKLIPKEPWVFDSSKLDLSEDITEPNNNTSYSRSFK